MERQVELPDTQGRRPLAGSGLDSVCDLRTDCSCIRPAVDLECGASVVLFSEDEMAGRNRVMVAEPGKHVHRPESGSLRNGGFPVNRQSGIPPASPDGKKSERFTSAV